MSDGTQGLPGRTGDQGLVGDQGAAGDRGHAGDQGVQGVQGIQGVRGLKGPMGDQGLPVALTGFADSQAKLAEAVADLVRIIAGQTATIAEQTALLRQVSRRLRRERIVAGVLVAILLWIGVTNRDSIAILKSATTPEGEIFRRGQQQTAGLLLNFSIEMDCRDRRRDAGMPAPVIPRLPDGTPDFANASFSCVAQTPPDVFPGLP